MSCLLKNRLFLTLFCGLIILGGCKLGHPDHTITVEMEDGVTGTPEAGKHSFKELEKVVFEYKYEDEDREGAPRVFLNESSYSIGSGGTGAFNVYTDTRVFVGDPDIRDTWTMVFYDRGGKGNFWKITFEGVDINSGTFSIDTGRTGSWEFVDLKLVMEFDNWEGYKLTADAGPRFINGEWEGPDDTTGRWRAFFEK